jgi:hypothetical protein
MRFAVSSAFKAIVLGVLGCAAALLVACGDTNGLLRGGQASQLSSALDGVASACQGGDVARAQAAAAQFRRELSQLDARSVDTTLIRELRQGAVTLDQLIGKTCTAETVPTETTVTPQPQTQPTAPPTTQPTTPPTTQPTTPPATQPTTPPDTGGDTTTTPPETGGSTGGDPSQPDVNDGNPGGALAPGQGGTP